MPAFGYKSSSSRWSASQIVTVRSYKKIVGWFYWMIFYLSGFISYYHLGLHINSLACPFFFTPIIWYLLESSLWGQQSDAQTTLPWIIPKPEEICPRASIWWDISPSPHMPPILSDRVSLTLSLRLSPESLQKSWICLYPQSQSPGSKTADSSVLKKTVTASGSSLVFVSLSFVRFLFFSSTYELKWSKPRLL